MAQDFVTRGLKQVYSSNLVVTCSKKKKTKQQHKNTCIITLYLPMKSRHCVEVMLVNYIGMFDLNENNTKRISHSKP